MLKLFKAFYPYKLDNTGQNIDTDAIHDGCAKHKAREASNQEMSHAGWGFPIDGKHVLTVGNYHLLCYIEYKKVIPAPVVKKAVADKTEKFKQSKGRAPSNSDKQDIKDAVMAELLPKAFQKQIITPMIIDAEHGVALVFASSLSKTSDVAVAFVKDTNLKITPFAMEPSVLSANMTQWLLDDAKTQNFEIGTTCTMESESEAKSKVKLSIFDLTSETCIAHVQDGYQVVALELSFPNHNVVATITKDCVFKSIKSLCKDDEKQHSDDPVSELSFVVMNIANAAQGMIQDVGLEVESD